MIFTKKQNTIREFWLGSNSSKTNCWKSGGKRGWWSKLPPVRILFTIKMLKVQNCELYMIHLQGKAAEVYYWMIAWKQVLHFKTFYGVSLSEQDLNPQYYLDIFKKYFSRYKSTKKDCNALRFQWFKVSPGQKKIRSQSKRNYLIYKNCVWFSTIFLHIRRNNKQTSA